MLALAPAAQAQAADEHFPRSCAEPADGCCFLHTWTLSRLQHAQSIGEDEFIRREESGAITSSCRRDLQAFQIQDIHGPAERIRRLSRLDRQQPGSEPVRHACVWRAVDLPVGVA